MQLSKIALGILATVTVGLSAAQAADRPRDLGIEIGVLHTGTNNAITDVKGVKVGQVTLVDEKKGMHTGVTAIVPHDGNIFKEYFFATSTTKKTSNFCFKFILCKKESIVFWSH